MANIQKFGQAKPKAWEDGSVVSNASAIGDGTVAEAMAALGYGWDATSSTWTKLPVDHTTGALSVNIAVSNAGLATDANLNTLFGTESLDPAGTIYLLNQLERIRKLLVQEQSNTAALLALQTPKPAPPRYTTLLHR